MNAGKYGSKEVIEISRYRRLYSAVIAQACRDYLSDNTEINGVKTWLFEDDYVHPNSFFNLCLFLDIDMQKIRDKLVYFKANKMDWGAAEKEGRKIVRGQKPIEE